MIKLQEHQENDREWHQPQKSRHWRSSSGHSTECTCQGDTNPPRGTVGSRWSPLVMFWLSPVDKSTRHVYANSGTISFCINSGVNQLALCSPSSDRLPSQAKLSNLECLDVIGYIVMSRDMSLTLPFKTQAQGTALLASTRKFPTTLPPKCLLDQPSGLCSSHYLLMQCESFSSYSLNASLKFICILVFMV
jgi:hypothetical protein